MMKIIKSDGSFAGPVELSANVKRFSGLQYEFLTAFSMAVAILILSFQNIYVKIYLAGPLSIDWIYLKRPISVYIIQIFFLKIV